MRAGKIDDSENRVFICITPICFHASRSRRFRLGDYMQWQFQAKGLQDDFVKNYVQILAGGRIRHSEQGMTILYLWSQTYQITWIHQYFLPELKQPVSSMAKVEKPVKKAERHRSFPKSTNSGLILLPLKPSEKLPTDSIIFQTFGPKLRPSLTSSPCKHSEFVQERIWPWAVLYIKGKTLSPSYGTFP